MPSITTTTEDSQDNDGHSSVILPCITSHLPVLSTRLPFKTFVNFEILCVNSLKIRNYMTLGLISGQDKGNGTYAFSTTILLKVLSANKMNVGYFNSSIYL